MEGPAFATNPQWAGCYCQFYLQANQPGPELRVTQNRQRACDRIESGAMRGYVAYDGDEMVGWVAANNANNFALLPPTSEDTARVMCFIVEERHQGKGVSRELLNFAIQDLKEQGFTSIEAAPRAKDDFSATGYRGKLSTFVKAGFAVGPMIDEDHILVHMNFTA